MWRNTIPPVASVITIINYNINITWIAVITIAVTANNSASLNI